ncbi:YciI family protein [Fulvivirgaceae bacterium BMA12]|uniref:YciI family protein n=1 Tax=Agaribacillus aureus TaxID=3051825 RepID=A0ABT8LA66_9BACT|nr:YciI family protein [Fulvivirgaceae bacterium BMA12]
MKEFLMILKGNGLATLSPEEMQKLLQQYKQWVADLGDQYVTGQRLENHGALLENKDSIVTDGPFLEPKEIIAGYFLIRAEDQAEANNIALSSPYLGLYTIEVRPLVQPLMH